MANEELLNAILARICRVELRIDELSNKLVLAFEMGDCITRGGLATLDRLRRVEERLRMES
jgi:hypothetical protein